MTREEAKEIFLNRGFVNGIFDGDKWRESCVVISDWLKQESKALERTDVLNKIRAEVASISPKTYPFYDHLDDYVKTNDVLQIIDKYRKEQE